MRTTTPADLPEVAALHRRELPHGLFPSLGERFLRVYQRSFVDSPYGLSLVATTDDSVVGFIAGATDAAHHTDWVLRRDGLRLAAWGLVGLALHPQTLWWFLRTRVRRYARTLLGAVRSRGATTNPDDPVDGTTVGVLTHVAVAPAARRVGLGRHLTERFADLAFEAGSDELRVVTRADSRAGGFYAAMGWEPLDERCRYEATVREYRLAPSLDTRP